MADALIISRKDAKIAKKARKGTPAIEYPFLLVFFAVLAPLREHSLELS
jgi:hypothetical protein